MRFFYYIFIIICFNSCFFCNSQNLQFDNYTHKDGLISDEVYNLFQDKKGYIWLFTNYGAMKYNGEKFQQVLKNLPFNESFIYAFYENEKGEKWIANSNCKIYEVRHDSAFLVKGTEFVSSLLRKKVSEINQIYSDDSSNIFVCTKSYSYKFIKSKAYRPVCLNKKVTIDTIMWQMIEKKNKILFVFNYTEIPFTRPTVKFEYTCFPKYEKNKIISLNVDIHQRAKNIKKYDELIYFTSKNKIFLFDKEKIIDELNFNSFILNFTKDKNNHLWVACLNDGLYELDEKNKIISHYFPNKTVNDVMCDSQNGIWVSTDRFGVFHSRGLKTYCYNEGNDLAISIGFIKQIGNDLFVSTTNGNIFMFNENGEKKVISSKLDEKTDILLVNDKYIVSSSKKIETYSNDKKFKKQINKYDKDFTSAFKLLKIGKDSVLCLQRKGYSWLYKGNFIDTVYFNYKIYWGVIRNNKLLLGTDDGVYECENNILKRPDYLKITSNSIVKKIRKDSLGNFWFCSVGDGLFKLSIDNYLTHYNEKNLLPTNIVNDICFSSTGSVFLSTNLGLFFNQNGDFKTWNIIYQEPVSYLCEYKKQLYLATKNGLVILDYNALSHKKLYFNLVSVLINSNPVKIEKIENLKFNENNLEFQFDIIDFCLKAPNIKYKLQGNIEYEGETDKQQISFQNLPHGRYKLIIELLTSDNRHKPFFISFEIHPAYWQTNWFIFLSIFFAFCVVYIVFYIIIRTKRKKENLKIETQRLITEYKLIALKAQINPHFMSNCLTAIQHLIFNNRLESANQYIAKFSFLVRQVLNFSSKSLVILYEELEVTKLNVELELLRFEDKFDFEVKVDTLVDLKELYVPPLIMQPIVENAIWHGLLPLKNLRKGKLIIEINADDACLYITIEDNGVGRGFKKDNIGNLKESKGIEITKQRILNVNNLLNKNVANLVYEDVVDNFSKVVGTRVKIILSILKTLENE